MLFQNLYYTTAHIASICGERYTRIYYSILFRKPNGHSLINPSIRVPVFFHSFSMFLPTRHSVHLSIHLSVRSSFFSARAIEGKPEQKPVFLFFSHRTNDLTKKLEKVGPIECDELEKHCRVRAKCYPTKIPALHTMAKEKFNSLFLVLLRVSRQTKSQLLVMNELVPIK